MNLVIIAFIFTQLNTCASTEVGSEVSMGSVEYVIVRELEEDATLQGMLDVLLTYCNYTTSIDVINYGLCFDECTKNVTCQALTVGQHHTSCRFCLKSESPMDTGRPDSSRTFVPLHKLYDYECLSSPCQNGGRCVNGDNSYTCACAESYTGTNCERRNCDAWHAWSGIEYKYFSTGLVRIGARAKCESHGGHLVDILSEDENNFIQELAMECVPDATDTQSFLSDGWETTSLRWLTIDEAFGYTNWAPDEPDPSDSRYAVCIYVMSGQWHDCVEYVVRKFICERQLV